MFQKLKSLETSNYEEKAWQSTRIKELVDSGMKKKDAMQLVSKESKYTPWEKKRD